MYKNNGFFKLMISLLAIATGFSINNQTKLLKAEDDEPIVLSMKELLTAVYDNDLNDVSSTGFSYGTRHGHLTTGDNPLCAKFTTKDAVNKGDMRADGDAYSDWAGARLNSCNNDRFIIKFTATDNIAVTTSISLDAPTGGVDDSVVNYIVADSSYNESNPVYLDKNIVYSIANVKGSSSADFAYTVNVNAGETFYWEWGFQWSGWSRNFNVHESGLAFTITKNSSPIKTQKIETYKYADMVGFVSGFAGNNVTPLNSGNVLMTYGMKHGSVSGNNIVNFDEYHNNVLGISTDNPNAAFFENWRMCTANGDAAIIYFKAYVKSYLTISRVKLGYDWLEESSLNIYLNGNKVFTKTFDGSTDTTDDFTYNVLMEEDDELYWEFMYEGSGYRKIAMGAAGDYSTLPTFKATEYVEVEGETLTLDKIVEDVNKSANNSVSFVGGLGTYQVCSGTLLTSLAPLDKNESYLGNDNAGIKADGITLNNSSVTISFKTFYSCNISVSYNANVLNGSFNLKGYLFSSTKNRTQIQYDVTVNSAEDLNKLNGMFVLGLGDTLYLEYSASCEAKFNNLEGIRIEEKVIGDGIVSDFPIYNPSDFSNKTSLTHKEIAFETAKTKGEVIKAKDFDIQLSSGLVSEESGELLSKFDNYMYQSGEYLETSDEPKMLISGSNGEFDGENCAAVEDYRLKCSSVAGVVYKVVATSDIELKVTHGATKVGWIDEVGKIYVAGYQSNSKVTKLVQRFDVVSTTNDENAFAITFNLQAGDIAYYVFGCDVANQRNLDLAPTFTSSVDNYDAEKRNEVMGASSIKIEMYDAVTDCINNDCEPVNYEDAIELEFAHGSVSEHEKFGSLGTGDGSENDSLINGDDGANLARFWRWQVRAGKLGDDALVIFKALKNIHLTINHQATKDAWATASSFKYYVLDIDDFSDFKEERYVSSDLGDNFFGYEIHLKQGQSLVIDYTSNDESNYGVVDFMFTALVNTKDFDESLCNDFTNSRNVQTTKDTYHQNLLNKVNSLSEADYSISNWAKIMSFISEYEAEVEKLTNVDDVEALYQRCINGINGVKTIQEETAEITKAINDAISEATAYISGKEDNYDEEAWREIESLFDAFVMDVNSMTSITNISLRLQTFKNAVDAIPVKQSSGGCGGSIVSASILIASISLCGAILVKGKSKEQD